MIKLHRQQIELIAAAAKGMGCAVTKLGNADTIMLGNTIQINRGSKFWIISTTRIGVFLTHRYSLKCCVIAKKLLPNY